MFVVSRRNIILPGPNGEKFHMPRDYMGSVPAWAEESAYLKALAEDGKVILSDSGKDKGLDAADKKRKKAKKSPEPEDPPEGTTDAPAGEPPEES